MKTDCGKIPYETRALAVVALGIYRDQLKRRGRGKDFRKLHVYLCPVCPDGIFHLGRSNVRRISETEVQTVKKPATAKHEAPPPAKKVPSSGELKRKLKAIDKRLTAELKHRAYVLGQMIQADAQRDYEAALVAIGIKG
jgi:hypothetical protein